MCLVISNAILVGGGGGGGGGGGSWLLVLYAMCVYDITYFPTVKYTAPLHEKHDGVLDVSTFLGRTVGTWYNCHCHGNNHRSKVTRMMQSLPPTCSCRRGRSGLRRGSS